MKTRRDKRKQEETRRRRQTDGVGKGEISNLGIAFSSSSADLFVDGSDLGGVCMRQSNGSECAQDRKQGKPEEGNKLMALERERSAT